MGTDKQLGYISRLADQLGYEGRTAWAYAASAVTGRSVSNIERKGLSVREASEVIDALSRRVGR
jgi:hypothetical protein